MKKVKPLKNSKIFFLALFIAIAFLSLYPQIAIAEEIDFTDRADDIDYSEFEEFIDGLSERQKNALGFSSVKDLIEKFLDGDTENFFDSFYENLGLAFTEYFFCYLPSFLAILTIAIFTSILSQAVSGFKRKSTEEVVRFVSFGAIATILVVIIGDISTMCINLLNGIKKITSFLFPPLLTLLSMIGGITTSNALRPLMAVLSGGIISLVTSIIFPIFLSTTILSIVGNISKEVRLDKLSKSFKSFGSYLLGTIFSLFIAFITFQGISSSAFDSVTFNATKFMVSSYVPILGGYLSDGYDLAFAGMVLLKNSIGFVGVLILLSFVAFPVIKILILSLSLKITSALIEPLGEKRISNMLSMLSKNVMLLVAAIVGVTFMLLVLLMLTITSCNMGIV